MRADRLVQAAAAALVLLLAAGAPARVAESSERGPGGSIKGSGRMEKRVVPFDEFSRIRLDGAIDIEVRFGDEQKVEFYLDDNLVDNLRAESTERTLTLDWARECRPSDGSLLAITAKKLEAAEIRGAGDIQVSGFPGGTFTYELSGAGNLAIDGTASELVLVLSGAGNVDARGLAADVVDARIPGVGDVTVTAKKTLRATISGVGNLVYYGDPKHRETSVTGVGSIEAR